MLTNLLHQKGKQQLRPPTLRRILAQLIQQQLQPLGIHKTPYLPNCAAVFEPRPSSCITRSTYDIVLPNQPDSTPAKFFARGICDCARPVFTVVKPVSAPIFLASSELTTVSLLVFSVNAFICS